MRKQRKPITFLGYDGKIKDQESASGLRWRTIGRFSTVAEARTAGATKLTPRYAS